MDSYIIPTQNGFYSILKTSNYEYQNPLSKYSELFIDRYIFLFKTRYNYHNQVLPRYIYDLLHDAANQEWEKEYTKLKSIKLSHSLETAILADSKKVQVNALKRLTLTSEELISFFIKAGEIYDYKHSLYRSEFQNVIKDKSKLPKIIYKKDNGEIDVVGNSNLSKAQMNQILDQRKVTISQFLDNGKNWHCFFYNYKSISGKESHNDGEPHIHYISDKWGIPRENVLNQLLSKDHSLPSIHIHFLSSFYL